MNRTTLILATLLLIGAAGCARGPGSGSAPDFTLHPPAWTGAPAFTLSAHRDKPTLLYFMAAWCITCVPEAKALAVLYAEFGERVNLIAVDVDPVDNEDGLRRFKKAAKGADHLWSLDDHGRLRRAYHVTQLDITVIIDAAGHERYRAFGPRGQATLREALIAAGAATP